MQRSRLVDFSLVLNNLWNCPYDRIERSFEGVKPENESRIRYGSWRRSILAKHTCQISDLRSTWWMGFWCSRTWRWSHLQSSPTEPGRPSCSCLLDWHVYDHVLNGRLFHHLHRLWNSECALWSLDWCLVRDSILDRPVHSEQSGEEVRQTIAYCLPAHIRPWAFSSPRSSLRCHFSQRKDRNS